MITALQTYPALAPKTQSQRNSNRALRAFLLGAAISLIASFSLLVAAVYIH